MGNPGRAIIEVGEPRELGVDGARLSFSISKRDTPDGPRFNARQLILDGEPAFELSFWCGTCSFLFERLAGANEKLSLAGLEDRLNAGLEDLAPDVLDAFGALLPVGRYVPMLFTLEPHMVYPGDGEDYFSREQLETWGPDHFWGLPNYPRTPYARAFETRVPGGTPRLGGVTDGHLFEFVVPMVPPSWNDPGRVDTYRNRLRDSSRPTAVALSLLDVCQPATLQGPESGYFAHWALTHFLLDGHHKLQAASEEGLELRMLAIVSVDHSLATIEDVQRLADLRGRPLERRSTLS